MDSRRDEDDLGAALGGHNEESSHCWESWAQVCKDLIWAAVGCQQMSMLG